MLRHQDRGRYARRRLQYKWCLASTAAAMRDAPDLQLPGDGKRDCTAVTLMLMRFDAAIINDLSLSIQLGYSVCLSGGMIWSRRCHGALVLSVLLVGWSYT